jgi:hypothetical protein
MSSLLPVQAFKQGPDADSVFFVELNYENSKELYKRLNVKSLPFIFHWGPESSAKEGRSIKLSKSSQVRRCSSSARTQVIRQHKAGLPWQLLAAADTQQWGPDVEQSHN